ncbi:MAG: 30S ribosomal protein S7, partial [Gammaproteobacteria bacterium]|nr:30S ribosomal protein S7 [Gammaproteobacteria bacterium]
MSRRRQAASREILPDPKFGDVRVAKFINAIMKSGKKAVAERILYGALDIIEQKGKGEPLEVMNTALDAIAPSVEVKSR